MSVLVLLPLLLLLISGSDATWCVCRSDVSTAALQKSLDYACGAGADCTPILQNGVCYLPNTVKDHCSYAANSYFQRKGQAQGTCDFAGTAITVTTDPSPSTTCVYPSGASGAASATPTSTPAAGTPSSTGTTTPFSGGTMSSISPSSFNDPNGTGFPLRVDMGLIFLALCLSSLLLLSGPRS